MEYVLLTTMIVGVVELVTSLFDRNFRTAVIIVCAALVGAVCGVFGVEGLDVATGIAVGLAASGVVTVAKKV
jgi:hypothetical protein